MFVLPTFGAMRRLFTHTSHYYFLCGLFFIVLIIWLPDSGYDKYFWVSWAKYIRLHGLSQAYNNPEVNYHPVILFIISVYTFFLHDVINATNINWLKVPTAIFDWGIIFIVLQLLKEHKKNLQWALLLVFNPAFWYNTIIWGQFDSIWVFFILLAFYLADKKYFFYSVAAFVLALNTKLFALFFLPFLGLIWVGLKPDAQNWIMRWNRGETPFYTFPKNVSLLFSAVVFQTLILFPFLYSTNYSLLTIIQRSTEYYNSLSRNAYNIWYYLFNDPVNTADSAYLIPSIIVVGIIFSILLFLQYKNKITVWNALALASLVFFLFLTRMHERYAHAALVFSGVVFLTSPRLAGASHPSPFNGEGAGKRRLWWNIASFLLIPLAYFLNLEAVMQTANKSLGLSVDYSGILFNPKMVATLYFIACLILAYNTFKSVANFSSPLARPDESDSSIRTGRGGKRTIIKI